MTPRELAESAERLLTDPVMKKVFVDIREGLVAKLETIPLSDTETQHEITLMLQLLRNFQGKLSKYMGDEVVARHRIKQDKFIESKREGLARAANKP